MALRLCPMFWFVKEVEHHELANVCLAKHDTEVHDVKMKVPVMQAKKKIQAGTQLTCVREKIE